MEEMSEKLCAEIIVHKKNLQLIPQILPQPRNDMKLNQQQKLGVPN